MTPAKTRLETPEQMRALGFTEERFVGWSRTLSLGPGSSKLSLVIGRFPFNEVEVTLMIDGYGIAVNVEPSVEEIEELIRLFKDAPIEHPELAGDHTGEEEST